MTAKPLRRDLPVARLQTRVQPGGTSRRLASPPLADGADVLALLDGLAHKRPDLD